MCLHVSEKAIKNGQKQKMLEKQTHRQGKWVRLSGQMHEGAECYLHCFYATQDEWKMSLEVLKCVYSESEPKRAMWAQYFNRKDLYRFTDGLVRERWRMSDNMLGL